MEISLGLCGDIFDILQICGTQSPFNSTKLKSTKLLQFFCSVQNADDQMTKREFISSSKNGRNLHFLLLTKQKEDQNVDFYFLVA